MKKLIAAAALLPLLAYADCEMTRYKRVQASSHVTAFESAEGSIAVVNGNILAIVGTDAVMVVDTGQFPSIARRVVAEIRGMTKAPVRYVVNTHWHGDHLLANGVFKEAWPGARFIAHSHTIEQGPKYYTDYPAKARAQLPVVIDQMKKQRAESTDEDLKLWIDRTVECADAIMTEVADMNYVAPDLPVDTEMTVDLGGVTAVVKHIGTGNTPGDLVVWVVEDRLVATGDMLVYPVPYAIGSAIEPWTKTLGELRKMNAAVVVPGHGPVMHDDRYIRDVEALLVTTRAQLVEMEAKGVSKKDAAEKLDVAEFRKRYVTTPLRRASFEQFYVKAAIQQIWPKTPPPPPAPSPPAAPR
jgi:cyclase